MRYVPDLEGVEAEGNLFWRSWNCFSSLCKCHLKHICRGFPEAAPRMGLHGFPLSLDSAESACCMCRKGLFCFSRVSGVLDSYLLSFESLVWKFLLKWLGIPSGDCSLRSALLALAHPPLASLLPELPGQITRGEGGWVWISGPLALGAPQAWAFHLS